MAASPFAFSTEPEDVVAAIFGTALYHGVQGSFQVAGFSTTGRGLTSKPETLIGSPLTAPPVGIGAGGDNGMQTINTAYHGFLRAKGKKKKLDMLAEWKTTIGAGLAKKFGGPGTKPISAEGFINNISTALTQNSPGVLMGGKYRNCNPCQKVFNQADLTVGEDGTVAWP